LKGSRHDIRPSALTPADGFGASSGDIHSDPWRALMQVGVQFIGALAAAKGPDVVSHPWIERDLVTGTQSLKIPLPPPEVAKQLADALSLLADGLRGKMA
jgi:hypothetical protein